MFAKDYKVFMHALENGILYGISRAFKHTEHPSKDAIGDAVLDAVASEITEWFDFEEGND